MPKFLTPEEFYKQKERRKVLLYIAFPIAAAAIGGVMTVLVNFI